MDENKLQRYFIFVLFLFIFHTIAVASAAAAAAAAAEGDEKEEHYMQVEGRKTHIIDWVRRMFYPPTPPSNYLMRVLHYFSTPSLDFRGVDEDRDREEGATEKLKVAVVKSVDKSQTMAQDSAKSAAKFAEEAVGETVNKVKKTLSADHEEEL